MSEIATNAGAIGSSTVSRRTVLKGAAWSVPAVMVAQMPVWAQAGTSDVFIDFGQSTACKIPGSSWGEQDYKWGYVLWAVVVNNTGSDVTITEIKSIKVGGQDRCVVGFTEPALDCTLPVPSVTIGEGETIIGIFTNANEDSASSNIEVVLIYTIGESDPITSPPLTGSVTGSPWTTGGGSCEFPPGCDSKPPPTPPSVSEWAPECVFV